MIVLTGDDSFAIKAELDRLVQDFVSKHGDLALEKLDGEEAQADKILDAMLASPFLEPAKMVVVRSAAAQKDLWDKLDDWIDRIPETNQVVLVDSKMDKRASYYKKLKKLKGFKDFSAAKSADLAGWLVQRAGDNGAKLSRSDAVFLIDRVGTDKIMLSNEIAKLASYDSHISRTNIELLCEPAPSSTIFNLIDAALSGNSKRVEQLYKDQRRQKMEPTAMIGMLAWQFHILATLRFAGDRTIDQIAKDSKINPFVLRKNQALAKKFSVERLIELLEKIAQLDVKLKSEPIDSDEAMILLLLDIGKR